jgi:hypothetical protein
MIITKTTRYEPFSVGYAVVSAFINRFCDANGRNDEH